MPESREVLVDVEVHEVGRNKRQHEVHDSEEILVDRRVDPVEDDEDEGLAEKVHEIDTVGEDPEL